MTRRLPANPLWWGLGLFSLLAFTGCASSSDVEKLNRGLSGQLQAMEARTQAQIGELSSQLKAVRSAQDTRHNDLVEAIAGTRADTKAALEAVKQGQASRSSMHEDLKTVGSRVENLHDGVMSSLKLGYKAEEAALRGRLKAVVEARQQLEAVTPPTQKGASASKEAAVRDITPVDHAPRAE